MKVKKQPKDKRISLDTEVVADLEATDAETEAIRGGRSSSGGSIHGSIAGSIGG